MNIGSSRPSYIVMRLDTHSFAWLNSHNPRSHTTQGNGFVSGAATNVQHGIGRAEASCNNVGQPPGAGQDIGSPDFGMLVFRTVGHAANSTRAYIVLLSIFSPWGISIIVFTHARSYYKANRMEQIHTTMPDSSGPANPPTSPAPPPASSTPTGQVFLTGSQLQPEPQKKLPWGVYAIVAFALLSFILSFFDTSQASLLYTIAMLLNLLLAVGLLLRMETARKCLLWLSGITLVLAIASTVGLYMVQKRIHDLKSQYDTIVSRIDRNRMTTVQKKQLDALTADLGEKEKQAGKAIALTYVKLGVTAVETVAVIVYLTRPKVKDFFHELGK
jgi:hypothetical protein